MISVPDYCNIVNTVISRERGCVQNLLFQSEVRSVKMQHLSSSHSAEIGGEITHCRLLKSCSKNSVVGIWEKRQVLRNSTKPVNAIYRIYFFTDLYQAFAKRDRCFVPDIDTQGPFYEKMDISDFIEIRYRGFECLLYCGNSLLLGGRVILNLMQYNNSRLPDEEWRFKEKLFCLAENFFTGLFAVGVQGGYYLFNSRQLYPICSFKDNVTSLAFNSDGTVLFIGRQHYNVTAIDFRCSKERHKHPEICKNLGSTNAKEIKVLSDQMSLIVSSEKLSKIDLRMGRDLFTFPEHTDFSSIRRTFSYNEPHDIICATGKDNCTRIWSLSTGKLMRTIAPFLDSGEPAHSCLKTDKLGWYMPIIEGDTLTTHTF